jgi:hypothetical protein
MKTKFIVLGVTAAALILAWVYLWEPGSVPAGQQPLAALSSTNADQFVKAFDADTGSTRLVLMLSPT